MELILTPTLRLDIINALDPEELRLAELSNHSNEKRLLAFTPLHKIDDLAFIYFREFIEKIFIKICFEHDLDSSFQTNQLFFSESELLSILESSPLFIGSEFLTQDWLDQTSRNIFDLLCINSETMGMRTWLQQQYPHWYKASQVYFHLAENKKNPGLPFAFLATFSTRQIGSKVKHLPLAQIFKQHQSDPEKLLSLLKPIQSAATQSNFLSSLISSNEIYKTLSWSPNVALNFLREISIYEENGIVVRIPNWWNIKRATKPKVQVTIDDKNKTKIGGFALLDFKIELTLGDQKLTN